MTTWRTDSSGNPARIAPPFEGKQVGVQFNANDFDTAIQEQGDRLQWEQASRCPCAANEQTGQPDPTCDTCGGAGWEYHSPLAIRGIVDRLDLRLDLLGGPLGDWMFGSAMVTVQPVHQPGYRDRYRLTDSVTSHSELVVRGPAGSNDRLAFPVATRTDAVLVEVGGELVKRNLTVGITRLRLMSDDRTPGPVLRQGVHFETDAAGRVDWSLGDAAGLAPRPTEPGRSGGSYAVTYLHHPSYLVQNWPYPLRVIHTQRKVASPQHILGPVSAMAMLEARQDKPAAQVPNG